MKTSATFLSAREKMMKMRNAAIQSETQSNIQCKEPHAITLQGRLPPNPENWKDPLYRVKTTREVLKSTGSIHEMSNLGSLRKMTNLNIPAIMSPESSRADSRVRSGSKSRIDFGPITGGLGKSIEQKIIDKRIKQMAKDWSRERSILRDEVRRLEFIVKQWQQLDKKQRNQRKQYKESGVTTETSMATQIQTISQEENQKLRASLKRSEAYKDEMMKDLQLMENQLKKSKVVPNYTPRSSRQESIVNQITNSSNPMRISMPQGKYFTGASLRRSALSRMRMQSETELGRVHEYYNRIIAQKDYSLEIFQQNFQSLQEELQQERHDTMTLLQRRTCELEKIIQSSKNADAKIIDNLRCLLERRDIQLSQQRAKVNTNQCELSLKNQLVEYLENQIMSLSQAHRRQPISSMEAFELVNNSFSKRDNQITPVCTSIHTQTESRCIIRFDEAVQVSTNTLDRTASYKNLHSEMDKLMRRSISLQEIVEEKDRVINEILRKSTQPNTTNQAVRALEKTCGELVIENNRLKAMILDNHSDHLIQDDMRIRVVSKDISKCDLSAINNPLLLKQISELRLFKAAASKELERLKNQLDESRRSSETYQKDQHFHQLQLSSQDRLLRNSFEVTISNLNSQINTLKTKLQGIQLRYDIKCRELKEKDIFIKNVIVSKVGREGDQSDIQYFSRKLDEFISVASPRSTSPKN